MFPGRLEEIKDKVVSQTSSKVLAASDENKGRDDRLTELQPTDETGIFEGIQFQRDGSGHYIVTKEIIEKVVLDTYNAKLKKVDRMASLGEVKEAMKFLDTAFYNMSKNFEDRLKFVDSAVLGVWTAEEVNYIGVGMGFEHFHLFTHNVEAAFIMVQAWNIWEYGHTATEGEMFWANVGFQHYRFKLSKF